MSLLWSSDNRAPNLNLLIKIARSLEVRPGELLDALVDEAEKNWRDMGISAWGVCNDGR